MSTHPLDSDTILADAREPGPSIEAATDVAVPGATPPPKAGRPERLPPTEGAPA